ncbi:hypothetical protein [Kaarinaea lacus]
MKLKSIVFIVCGLGYPWIGFAEIMYSFETINRYAESTTDFDEIDAARNFTSEALFSESEQRLGRPLTDDELRSIARTKPQFETFNILTIAPSDNNKFGFYYKYRDIENAQITNFYEPKAYNDVDIEDFGIKYNHAFNSLPYISIVETAVVKTVRKGLVEFLPGILEDILQFELNASLAKIYKNGNTSSLYATFLYQDIATDDDNYEDRDRQIASLVYTYGSQKFYFNAKKIFSARTTIESIFARRFDFRGLSFFGGVVYDKENYWDADVVRWDYFVGTSSSHRLIDATYKLTVFSSEVDNDPTQDNSQMRVETALVRQMKDNALLRLPVMYDAKLKGPDYYENWKAGLEVQSLFSVNNFVKDIELVLAYGYQSFLSIHKNFNLVGIKLSASF